MRTLLTFLLALAMLLIAVPASHALPGPDTNVFLSYDYDDDHPVSGGGSKLRGYTGLEITKDEYDSFRFGGRNYEFAFKVDNTIMAPDAPCFYVTRFSSDSYSLAGHCELHVGQKTGTATAILFDTSTFDSRAEYDYTAGKYLSFPYNASFIESNTISMSQPLNIATSYADYRQSQTGAMIAAAVAPAAMCEPLLFTPQPANLDLDTLPTTYKICEGYARLGKTPAQVLSAVRAASTISQWDQYQCTLSGVACQTGSDGAVIPPPAGPLYPNANDNPGQFPARTTADVLRLRQPNLTKTHAQKIADACRAYTERALARGANLAIGDARSACETMPIFIPGSDSPEATAHKIDAIRAQPEDVQLTFQNAAIKKRYLARGWYRGKGNCSQATPPDKNCDEYPFYASVEASATHSQIRYIDGTQNKREGGFYKAFTEICSLRTSTVPPPDPNGFPSLEPGFTGDPFLVVPMTDVPTSRICGRSLGQQNGPPVAN